MFKVFIVDQSLSIIMPMQDIMSTLESNQLGSWFLLSELLLMLLLYFHWRLQRLASSVAYGVAQTTKNIEHGLMVWLIDFFHTSHCHSYNNVLTAHS